MSNNRNRRGAGRINAGSTADIAFLMLIFFLVTTTILNDQGILVKLPPWEPETELIHYASRNVLAVNINAEEQILVDGEFTEVGSIRDRTKEFILNPQRKIDLAVSPRKAIVSLKHDRSTDYEAYLVVYNELKGAYNELWEGQAQMDYGKSFQVLSNKEKKSIRSKIPLIISEAEPSDFEEEPLVRCRVY